MKPYGSDLETVNSAFVTLSAELWTVILTDFEALPYFAVILCLPTLRLDFRRIVALPF